MASDTSSLSAQVKRLNIEDQTQAEEGTAPGELVAVVDDLLEQLGAKFSNISTELIAKMDEMSRRLDNLEAAIQASNSANAADAER